MSKILYSIASVLIIGVLASCSGNPFMNNIFSRLDEYELPDSFSSADDILDEAGDDGFLEALAADPELTEQVITLLEESLPDDPADAGPEDQEAALLLADVHIVTSDADETVNSVNTLAQDPDSVSFDSPEEAITDLYVVDESLSPAEQEASAEAQVVAFLAAADALEFYGDTLIAGQEPSPESNTGETAATAMMAGMTTYMIENMQHPNGDDMTDQEAIDALVDVIVYGSEMPQMAEPTDENGNPLPEDASTDEEMEAMLGPGLSEVVGEGFDLSSFGEM